MPSFEKRSVQLAVNCKHLDICLVLVFPNSCKVPKNSLVVHGAQDAVAVASRSFPGHYLGTANPFTQTERRNNVLPRII